MNDKLNIVMQKRHKTQAPPPPKSIGPYKNIVLIVTIMINLPVRF